MEWSFILFAEIEDLSMQTIGSIVGYYSSWNVYYCDACLIHIHIKKYQIVMQYWFRSKQSPPPNA